jgi:AcrR family transcriptional regulator
MADQETEPRMRAADRRERILAAAAEVFGRRGYVGATTDQIARAAGISQPYVVRMFGSKETLFLEVLDAAHGSLQAAFRQVLAANEAGGGSRDDLVRNLGERYVELARERGMHLPLMQAFVQGSDPVVGRRARERYLDIWRFLRDEAGLDGETARDFLARGMLISVLLGLDMPVLAARDDARELLEQACGDKLVLLLDDVG